MEYLARWISNNEVFHDEVRLESFILWPDGMMSTAITQPQYHGEPATAGEIDRFFSDAGWTKLSHRYRRNLFFNYAHEVLAMDAEGRNCYSTAEGLQPFDVILTRPDTRLEQFLELY